MIGAMRRLLSGVGRTLITVGVLLLLFVAYQLWGTGIRQAQRQTKLTNSFEAELAAAGITPIEKNTPGIATGTTPPAPPPSLPSPTDAVIEDPTVSTPTPSDPLDPLDPPTSVEAVPAPGGTTVAPTSSTAPPVTSSTLPSVRTGRSKMKAPKPGKAVGLLIMPRIHLRQLVVEGTATADLQTGPGRYSSTAYPGQPGNVGIAGHRTTYGAPFFNLHLMRIGDPIFIQTQQGSFRYDVIDACQPKCLGRSAFVVSPQNKTVLADIPGDNILTLTTCHPQYTARQRLIVRARLVGPAAAADFFEPPPTTVAPTTAPPSTVAPTSKPPSTIVAADSSADTAATNAPADTTIPAGPSIAVGTSIPADAAATTDPPTVSTDPSESTVAVGDPLSLQSERDPSGRGPVWKLSWLQGHRSTWVETGLLALLCALIWAVFWAIARRRRLAAQLVIYAVGFLVVFLPALYFAFEHVARLLPENL